MAHPEQEQEGSTIITLNTEEQQTKDKIERSLTQVARVERPDEVTQK
jgi:hypothetical protein